MLKLFLFTFILANLNFLYVLSKDICYGDLGCFTDAYPFSGSLQRPFALLPDKPERIATKFKLFTRNSLNGEVISALNLSSNYLNTANTKIIVHGFLDTSNKKWIISMKDAILSTENVNVIVTDWSMGNGFPYTQATANTQVVGAEIAKLIRALSTSSGKSLEKYHLIGHSLGSHISGYAGSYLNGKIGRITGLDPAGPYFENTEISVRLDPSDALYVDAIHSDGTANLQLGLGLMQPVGHADFYPNGGKDQPDCPTTSGKLLGAVFNLVAMDVQGIEDAVACSHFGAVYFFTDSLKTKACKYNAYECDSKINFDKGGCIKCSLKGCNKLGYFSSKNNDLGTLYLNTRSMKNQAAYCQQNYRLNLFSHSLNNMVQTRGKFTIRLRTSKQTTATEILDDSSVTFKQDQVNTFLLSVNDPIDTSYPVESIFLGFTKTGNLFSGWLYDDKWSFKYIELYNGETQVSNKYCSAETIIKSGTTVEFKKC